MNNIGNHTQPRAYIGRFAPSPTGPLHFGSLVAALASFLDARANGGQWLVRIEDLDPPREVPGASMSILETLRQHRLHWDSEVVYQSKRLAAYDQALAQLRARDRLYSCACSRQRLLQLADGYDGYCSANPPKPGQLAALRLRVQPCQLSYYDGIQGEINETLNSPADDFVVVRKDGLHSYQLAVVVDDIWTGVTQVVRGADLLGATSRQVHLFELLGAQPPGYAHLPLVLDEHGRKLSKQNHAAPLSPHDPLDNIRRALTFLGQHHVAQARGNSVEDLLRMAVERWQLAAVAANSLVLS